MLQDQHAICQRRLPDEGRFHFDDWVTICDCSKDSVDRTMAEYGIAAIILPGMKLIDAAIWWAAIYAKHPAAKPKTPKSKS